MNRSTIKLALFSLTGLLVGVAHANQVLSNDLQLLENLPVAQRVEAHRQVKRFLAENPDLAKVSGVLAVDSQGRVYALDEKQVAASSCGRPSTMAVLV